jgi:hypothetical protein
MCTVAKTTFLSLTSIKLVPYHSATLNWVNEHPFPVHADHNQMCKYATCHNETYKSIARRVGGLICFHELRQEIEQRRHENELRQLLETLDEVKQKLRNSEVPGEIRSLVYSTRPFFGPAKIPAHNLMLMRDLNHEVNDVSIAVDGILSKNRSLAEDLEETKIQFEKGAQEQDQRLKVSEREKSLLRERIQELELLLERNAGNRSVDPTDTTKRCGTVEDPMGNSIPAVLTATEEKENGRNPGQNLTGNYSKATGNIFDLEERLRDLDAEIYQAHQERDWVLTALKNLNQYALDEQQRLVEIQSLSERAHADQLRLQQSLEALEGNVTSWFTILWGLLQWLIR